jgi:hypothetical protein
VAGSAFAAILLALALILSPTTQGASAKVTVAGHVHEGVASCAGSTCHGRQVSSGLVVRQNELMTWQDSSSPAGSHSRAWRVLTEPRAQAIATRLGLGPAQRAPACLGCHADNTPAGMRGAKFQISDGVGCESCHGGSGGWLASHYTVGASHQINVAQGMVPLDNPQTRAAVCLDCHFGSAKPNQFVSHRLMSAGHPRIAFELDLFTELQRHHDVDADYAARKQVAGGVRTWAVGQAMALERALALYSDPARGQEGSFPEFYFFDCQSCHRIVSDDPKSRPSFQANPDRPIPSGMPPFNDENMILLSAAARVAAPNLAVKFETDSRAFHAAIARDRPSALHAAAVLSGDAHQLSSAFAGRRFDRTETFAMLDQVLGGALSPRITDYEGGAQTVMAIDTLLSALVAAGQVDRSAAAAIRPDINIAYRAVSDPNAFRPTELREALQRIANAVRRLR